MNKERELQFYRLFERLINTLADVKGFNREIIKQSTIDFCKFFNLSKGVTEFYRSPADQKAGIVETYCDYDTGEKSHIVVQQKIVTKSMTVIVGTLYAPDGAPPLPEDEIAKADLVLRALLSFISRRRLQEVVEMLGFYDNDHYRNMRFFIRYITQMQMRKELGGHTAVHFNLKHFSLINREIGRKFGDIVIRNYYTLLENIIGEDGVVCRVGGDNFIGIFNNAQTDTVIETFKGAPISYDEKSANRVSVTSRAGLFVIPDGFSFESPDELISKIMFASNATKNAGNSSIIFFDNSILEEHEKNIRIQQQFPIALEQEEFRVFYQPKVNVMDGSLVGAEALCRWFHNGKIVPPLDFIPILEQNTDVCSLDFYMLDHVCRDIRRWLDEGRKVVRISVNFSRKHFVDVDLLKHILDVVNKYDIPHEYIEIELTETTTDVKFRELKRVVSGLQQAGIFTSVDDFGVGYSSLNLIRDVPWNVLKIDKSFLPEDDDASDSTRNTMFGSVILMANRIGLECITEGVETEKQVGILRRNNCRIAQGFFFDKPLPLEDFEKRLSAGAYPIPDFEQ